MSAEQSPQESQPQPKHESRSIQMQDAVGRLIDEGKLFRAGKIVKNNYDKVYDYDVNGDNSPIFAEGIVIYTAPATRLLDLSYERQMNLNEQIKEEIGLPGLVSVPMDSDRISGAVDHTYLIAAEEIGKRRASRTVESTVLVQLNPSPLQESTTESWQESQEQPILRKTGIKIFPSIDHARLAYQFDNGDISREERDDAYRALDKADKPHRRREVFDKARKIVGLPPKQQ